MHSCIYEGRVRHRRFQPADHRFSYGVFLMYLDLDELPSLVGRGGYLSARRFAPATFSRADHFGRSDQDLDTAVRDLVDAQAGFRPTGPIRLLTHLRHFGYYMAPLSLFYCFDTRGAVTAVVAEVVNTPWRERHCYVLSDANRITTQSDRLQFQTGKEFHVSPFLDMDYQYHWQLSEPGQQLDVEIANYKQGRRVFDACLSLQRRELSRANVVRTLVHYPWMSARVATAIYFQALRLWMKKIPFCPHPRHAVPTHHQPEATVLK